VNAHELKEQPTTAHSHVAITRFVTAGCSAGGKGAVHSDGVAGSADFDWACLYRLAHQHDIVPLVYRGLVALGHDAFSGSLAPFRKKYSVNRERNLVLRDEFFLLIREFRRRNIEVLAYKEPLSFSLRNTDIGLRQFKDVDFLVKPGDLNEIYGVFSFFGYRLEQPERWFRDPCYERVAKDYSFVRNTAHTTGCSVPDPRAKTRKKAGWVIMEPHWSIAQSRLSVKLPATQLFDRRVSCTYRGEPINLLSLEDAHVVACIVGSKSEWRSLRLISDVAASIEASPGLDWALCVRRAERAGALRMFLLGNLLANRIAGAAVPDSVLAQATDDAVVLELADDVQTLILDQSFAHRVNPAVLSSRILKLRENHRHKLWYVISTATTPRERELRFFGLPPRLYFLYWLLVPISEYFVVPIARGLRSLSRAAYRVITDWSTRDPA
jgi:hypothetical protein